MTQTTDQSQAIFAAVDARLQELAPQSAGSKRRRRRGDGWLFPHPKSIYWWMAISYRGKVLRRSTGETDKKKAQERLNAWRDDLVAARRGHIPGPDPEVERTTVNQRLDWLLMDYELRGVKSLPQARAHVERIRDYFGPIRAVDLAEEEDVIDRYIAERQKAGTANATINRETQLLGQAITSFLEKHRRSVPCIRRLPEYNVRQGFFELADFEAVLEHLDDDADVKDFLEWFFWTGMRPESIRSLTWADFDRETWSLRLPAQHDKIGRGLHLALEGPYRAIIERRIKARRLDCPLIFHRDGRRLGEFRKAWKTACRAAGLEGKLPYDLRRTGLRNMIRAGVDPAVAMKISGHRTRSTFDRYNITDDRDLRDAVIKTAAYVATLPTDRTIVSLPQTQARQNR